ncbi:MAG: hypothetical protein JNL82_04430 [Myxococcales bacterium]|nr:hypothetical protein [Myxococcales bacterium]
MGADWRTFCRGSSVEVDGDGVLVRFESGRRHRVRVLATEDAFEFHAVVVRSFAGRSSGDLALRLWRLNRTTQLVSFRIDPRGRIVASGWLPTAGATAREFLMVLRRVAVESDRLEYLLTGKDRE